MEKELIFFSTTMWSAYKNKKVCFPEDFIDIHKKSCWFVNPLTAWDVRSLEEFSS